MSLYTVEEVCGNCKYVVRCERCGSIEYCKVEATINPIRGTCDRKEKE